MHFKDDPSGALLNVDGLLDEARMMSDLQHQQEQHLQQQQQQK